MKVYFNRTNNKQCSNTLNLATRFWRSTANNQTVDNTRRVPRIITNKITVKDADRKGFVKNYRKSIGWTRFSWYTPFTLLIGSKANTKHELVLRSIHVCRDVCRADTWGSFVCIFCSVYGWRKRSTEFPTTTTLHYLSTILKFIQHHYKPIQSQEITHKLLHKSEHSCLRCESKKDLTLKECLMSRLDKIEWNWKIIRTYCKYGWQWVFYNNYYALASSVTVSVKQPR